MSETAALEACVQYDHWAREIARLTKVIRSILCPHERDLVREDGTGLSCFRAACGERVEVFSGDPLEGDRPLRLEEVAERVRDCNECSRLARLVYERKVARRQWGAAKRRIRAIAKRATAEAPHA